MALVIYTSEEVAEQDRLMLKYREEMDQANRERKKAIAEKMFATDPEQFSRILEKGYQLVAEHSLELEAIEAVARQRYFDDNAGNFHQIISDLKEDIALSIKRLKTTREVLYSPRENWSFDMEQIKEIRSAFVFNENALKENPGDEELARVTEELKGTLHKLLTDSQYTNEWIDRTIVMNYSFYLDFLKDHDSKAREDMLLYIKAETGSTDLDSPFEKLFMFPESEAIINYPVFKGKIMYPEEFIMPIDRITKTLYFATDIDEGENFLKMEGKGNQPLTAILNVNFGELQGVMLSSNDFDSFDWLIYAIIVSLYVEADQKIIDLEQIHRIHAGKTATLTEKIKKDISDSIEKASSTRITIDARYEAKGYEHEKLKKKNNEGFNMDRVSFTGNLLYTKKISMRKDGKLKECIQIMDQPILYSYADAKAHVAREPIAVIQTPVSKNRENAQIQGMLLKRLHELEHTSSNISYDTIYNELDLHFSSTQVLVNKQKKIRDIVKRILTYWLEVHRIAGFKENTESGRGKRVKSVTVFLKEKEISKQAHKEGIVAWWPNPKTRKKEVREY